MLLDRFFVTFMSLRDHRRNMKKKKKRRRRRRRTPVDSKLMH